MQIADANLAMTSRQPSHVLYVHVYTDDMYVRMYVWHACICMYGMHVWHVCMFGM